MGRKDNASIKFKKDKFSQRAKLSGYRARSAYKLIQLQREHNLFSDAKVCIDLCAAPGSWMQVALKFMPAASVCIGVDLYPIKQIPNGISIVGDITSSEVRTELHANLKSWKADIVVHDGAPNVGNNWTQDAYNQNCLVLHAIKLACEFLKKGGKFVTKIFRSRDHTSIEYVLRKLFGKVSITKPLASRVESAEMFIICLDYLQPDKIDPKFFDPRHVFQIEDEPQNKLNVLHPEKTQNKALGYEHGVTLLHKKYNVSEFICAKEYLPYLELANEFEWDIAEPLVSDKYTQEIKYMCKDIKLLSRKDLRTLIKWRTNQKKLLDKQKEETDKANEPVKGRIELEQQLDRTHALSTFNKSLGVIKTLKEDLSEETELQEFESLERAQIQILELRKKAAQEAKNKLRRTKKKRKKELQKMQLSLVLNEDQGPTLNSTENLFSLDNFNKIRLSQVESYIPKTHLTSAATANFPMEIVENKFLNNILNENNMHDIVENWFSKDKYKDLENEAVEDFEIDGAMKFKSCPKEEIVLEDLKLKEKSSKRKRSNKDIEEMESLGKTSDGKPMNGISAINSEDDEDETDYDAFINGQKDEDKLSDIGLALATKLIRSKKTKRDIIDDSFNRYMWGEEDLPDFFREDEERYNMPRIKVDPEDLRFYRNKNKDVNARTLKKVVEAKARKARRTRRKMAKVNKKIENINSLDELSAKEKSHEIKKLYDKAKDKKKEVKYVVSKKSQGGKPKSLKGPYKVVDKRMKKDKRAMDRLSKKRGKKGFKNKGKGKW